MKRRETANVAAWVAEQERGLELLNRLKRMWDPNKQMYRLPAEIEADRPTVVRAMSMAEKYAPAHPMISDG
jgi:hypothetical protein